MLGDSLVHLYPAEELIAADFSVSSYELRAQRIDTLDHMARVGKGIYITPVAGMKKLFQQKINGCPVLCPRKWTGRIDIEEWLNRLVEMGYTRQAMVTAPGNLHCGEAFWTYILCTWKILSVSSYSTLISTQSGHFLLMINVLRANWTKFQSCRQPNLFGPHILYGPLRKSGDST